MVTNKDIITPLDIKYRQFADLIFSGMTQREAYIQLFGSESVEAVDANASRLIRSDRVQAILRELTDEADKKAIATPIQRLKKLTKMMAVDIPDSGLTHAHQLQAIDIMNKMNRLYSDNVTINFNEIKISLVEDEPCNMATDEKVIDV